MQITCTTLTYFIGGSVSGLAGSGLVLHLDSGQDIAVAANGSFMFATPLTDGSAYAVTVGTPPASPNQVCQISAGSGNLAGQDVTNVFVTCAIVSHTISGTVIGLDGSGLVLQLNGANDLPIPADGSFAFSQAIEEGAAYAVTVFAQPGGGTSDRCVVVGGTGTMNTVSVSDIVVICDMIFVDGFESP